jgi:hypothetical protein
MSKIEQPLPAGIELVKIRTIQDALALTIGKSRASQSAKNRS